MKNGYCQLYNNKNNMHTMKLIFLPTAITTLISGSMIFCKPGLSAGSKNSPKKPTETHLIHDNDQRPTSRNNKPIARNNNNSTLIKKSMAMLDLPDESAQVSCGLPASTIKKITNWKSKQSIS